MTPTASPSEEVYAKFAVKRQVGIRKYAGRTHIKPKINITNLKDFSEKADETVHLQNLNINKQVSHCSNESFLSNNLLELTSPVPDIKAEESDESPETNQI